MTPRPSFAPEVLAMLPDPLVVLDGSGTLQWANDAAIAFAGLETDEWIGRSVFDLLHPDDHAIALGAFETVAEKPVGGLLDVRIRDGTDVWHQCEIRGRFFTDELGEDRVVIVFRDVGDRQALELGQGDGNRLRAIVHHASSLLIALDAEGRLLSANGELTRLLGVDPSLVDGGEFAELITSADRPLFRDTLHSIDGSARVELRADHPDGRTVYLEMTITDLRNDPLVEGFTLSATDITDLKHTQQALRHMADHDALTGLFSRRALLRQLDTIVDDGFQHEIVVLFCDLDGFKAINDRIGHAAGDQVLVEVARRIERSIRPGDLVGRLGGDEFVVLLPRATPGVADEVAALIRQLLTQPIFVADELVEVDVSIGIAATGDSPTASRLLATADDAMYAVKNARKAVPNPRR